MVVVVEVLVDEMVKISKLVSVVLAGSGRTVVIEVIKLVSVLVKVSAGSVKVLVFVRVFVLTSVTGVMELQRGTVPTRSVYSGWLSNSDASVDTRRFLRAVAERTGVNPGDVGIVVAGEGTVVKVMSTSVAVSVFTSTTMVVSKIVDVVVKVEVDVSAVTVTVVVGKRVVIVVDGSGVIVVEEMEVCRLSSVEVIIQVRLNEGFLSDQSPVTPGFVDFECL